MKKFFLGLVFLVLGVFLVTENTIVRTGFNLGRLTGGYNPSFGVLLLPVLLGIVLLFAMKRKIWGGILIIFGISTIVLSLLMGLEIYFRSTSLYVTVLMFGTIAVGIGLMLRGVFQSKKNKDY